MFNIYVFLLVLFSSFNLFSEEYIVTFKSSMIIEYGGDPACDCPWPENSPFIDEYTNREVFISDNTGIINKYFTLQKSFGYNSEPGGKEIWKLKKQYQKKRYRIVVKYERCRDEIDEDFCQRSVSYNHHLKSIYQID
jgi:hypothetical protein